MMHCTDPEDVATLVGPAPLEVGEAAVPGYKVIAHLHRSKNIDVYDVFSQERGCRCIAKLPIMDRVEKKRIVHA